MDLRVYEALFHFNQGLDQAYSSVEILEKLEAQSLYCIGRILDGLSELRAYANTHLASEIAQMENGEMEHFSNRREKRESEEANPDQIYMRLESLERLRRERGLPPRAIVLPWTKADDDRAIARLMTLYSAPPNPPASNDAPQGDPKGAES